MPVCFFWNTTEGRYCCRKAVVLTVYQIITLHEKKNKTQNCPHLHKGGGREDCQGEGVFTPTQGQTRKGTKSLSTVLRVPWDRKTSTLCRKALCSFPSVFYWVGNTYRPQAKRVQRVVPFFDLRYWNKTRKDGEIARKSRTNRRTHPFVSVF